MSVFLTSVVIGLQRCFKSLLIIDLIFDLGNVKKLTCTEYQNYGGYMLWNTTFTTMCITLVTCRFLFTFYRIHVVGGGGVELFFKIFYKIRGRIEARFIGHLFNG